MAENESQSMSNPEDTRRKQEMAAIEHALRGLRFGSVNLIVQDGILIQIDRLEKNRLRPRRLDPASE